MSKLDVQQAAHIRLETMRIPLASRFREPVAAIVSQQNSGWLGFLKLDLFNPSQDGIALLRGHRLFTMQLQNGEYVVGKAEKGFKFLSTASNMRLKLQSPMLGKFTSRQLLGELIRLGYSSGHSLEIIGVAKRTQEQTTADITVASEHTKNHMIQYPLIVNGDRITVSIAPHPSTQPNTPGAALTTMLIVKNIPLQYSQIQVTQALQRLLSPRNVVSISYSDADNDSIGRHEGSALIRCLNAAVYTYWSNRRAVPLLGKFVDFVPHRRSIAGANPNEESYAHDACPIREVLADEITALKNQLPSGPSINQMEASLKEIEARIEARLVGLRDHINLHTTSTIEVAATANAARQEHLLRQMQLLTHASAEYNRKMMGISSALAHGQTELPPAHTTAPANGEI